MRTSYLLSATAMAMLVGATAASAGTVTIKDVEVDPSNPYNYVNITGDVPGRGSVNTIGQISGLILLTTSTGQTLPVFCVDLFHDVGIGGGQKSYVSDSSGVNRLYRHRLGNGKHAHQPAGAGRNPDPGQYRI